VLHLINVAVIPVLLIIEIFTATNQSDDADNNVAV